MSNRGNSEECLQIATLIFAPPPCASPSATAMVTRCVADSSGARERGSRIRASSTGRWSGSCFLTLALCGRDAKSRGRRTRWAGSRDREQRDYLTIGELHFYLVDGKLYSFELAYGILVYKGVLRYLTEFPRLAFGYGYPGAVGAWILFRGPVLLWLAVCFPAVNGNSLLRRYIASRIFLTSACSRIGCARCLHRQQHSSRL